jgi:hypothetical protein
MEERRSAYKIIAGNREEKRSLGRLRLCGAIIFKWIIKKLDV